MSSISQAGGAPPAAAADPSYPLYEEGVSTEEEKSPYESYPLKTTLSLQEKMLREGFYTEENNPIQTILSERRVAVDMEGFIFTESPFHDECPPLIRAVQDICTKILDDIESKAEETFPLLKTDREIDPIMRYDQIHQRVYRAASILFKIDPSHYSLSDLIDAIKANREQMLFSFLKKELSNYPFFAKKILKKPFAEKFSLKDLHVNEALDFMRRLAKFDQIDKHKRSQLICALINSPYFPDDHRGRIVHWTSRLGHCEIVIGLLKNGTISDNDRGESVKWAATNGDRDIAITLLQNGKISDNHRDQAVKLATRNGHIEIVELLIPEQE